MGLGDGCEEVLDPVEIFLGVQGEVGDGEVSCQAKEGAGASLGLPIENLPDFLFVELDVRTPPDTNTEERCKLGQRRGGSASQQLLD